jgi:hypothetical protein
MMKVEVLYFDRCPTYEAATNTLQAVLAEEGVEAEVRLIAVSSDEEARRLRFPGSPTLRVDGRDLFPAPERDEWGLGCRVYATPEGLRGSPTAEMFRDTLTTGGGAGADRHLWRRSTRDGGRSGAARGSAPAQGVRRRVRPRRGGPD